MTGDRRRAVLFGGAGFVGSHLARHLMASGWDVTVADIARPILPLPGARLVFADVRQPIALPEYRADVAFNLAAVHRTPGHPDAEYYDTNVAGALNVTAWCQRREVPSLVFTSSISVYGATEQRKTEASSPEPTSAYGKSKLLAEHIHQRWSEETGGKLVIARPAVVFGPGENGNFTRLANALARGRFVYPGRDDTIKACGYVADLVGAMLFGLEQNQRQYLFNYCYPHASSIREICGAFEDVAGYKNPKAVPAAAVMTALNVLRAVPGSSRSNVLNPERVEKLTASTNIAPDVLLRSGFTWTTDLRSGLRDWHNADPHGRFV